MQTKFIEADYCSWIVVNFNPPGLKDRADLYVRGDIQGSLAWNNSAGTCTGWFELPARGEELGYYEITLGNDHQSRVLHRVNIRYTFDKFFFPPRWENINRINTYLARRFNSQVQREILYRYPRYRRDIQLLKITDPAVPMGKKQVILLTARVHNPESGTTASLFRFVKWLLEGNGREFLRDYLFLVIPMVIPLTFEEDPREHAVNREWRDEMVEPDLSAIREKVIDRYLPEVWIDCHTFNAEMDLANKKEMRERYGDYIVAHPPTEQFFDYGFSRDIARRLIRAAEIKGHRHRTRAWFLRWQKDFQKGSFVRPGEKVKTDFDPAGIFSGWDYAFYADRDVYGLTGRTWAAMACDYGYDRCHAVNMCLESKPLHVYWGNGPFHYPRRFADSTVVKLQELCHLGRESFPGQPRPGFPCNLILSDPYQNKSSILLCAWGQNRADLRHSRMTLWRHRRSLQIRLMPSPNKSKATHFQIFCICSISPTPAALRVTPPSGFRSARITLNNRKSPRIPVHQGYLYLPLKIQPGKQNITVHWQKK